MAPVGPTHTEGQVKIAKEDGYVEEDVGYGNTVRRRIVAGTPVAPNLQEGADVEFVEPNAISHEEARGLDVSKADGYVEEVVTPLDGTTVRRQVVAGSPGPLQSPLADTHIEGESEASYSSRSKEDLEVEAQERGIYDDIEGSGADGNVVKADLVAALQADDDRNA